MKKIILLFMVAIMVCSTYITAFATQRRDYNFSANYKLTGIYASDIVTVAEAQLGKKKAQLGYTEAWCADFVTDCARLTKMSDKIIPYNYSSRGACTYLYNYMEKNCNATKVTSRAKGDLVFYYCSKCARYVHVGIVKDLNTSIEGNYGGKVSKVTSAYTDSVGHSIAKGQVSRVYLRPNYMQSQVNNTINNTISNTKNVSYLFDAVYYSTKYPDLNRAFGYDENALYNHWINFGMEEGRSPSPIYDPEYYRKNNADLNKAFGTDYKALYNHFVTYGRKEFRKSSPIYDGGYYKSKYVDLRNAFGDNSISYIEHFIQFGMKEGRNASVDFNVHNYKNRYSDLINAFGNDLKSYYYHYMEYGINEGRNCK